MGFTCNDCRWKVERNECPWDYDYDDEHDYAEDCIDFRNVSLPETAFNPNVSIKDNYNAGGKEGR